MSTQPETPTVKKHDPVSPEQWDDQIKKLRAQYDLLVKSTDAIGKKIAEMEQQQAVLEQPTVLEKLARVAQEVSNGNGKANHADEH